MTDKQKKNLRFIVKIVLWLAAIASFLGAYILYPELFDITFLQTFIADNYRSVAIIYIFILSILGLFFVPSTPFAISGVALFGPGVAYLLNLLGITSSSIIVYYFSRFLGFDAMLKAHYPQQLKRITNALQNKQLPIIILWSMFPLVPTDAIIYAASSLRVRLSTCLIGVLIGEGILNLFYIFGGYHLGKWIVELLSIVF